LIKLPAVGRLAVIIFYHPVRMAKPPAWLDGQALEKHHSPPVNTKDIKLDFCDSRRLMVFLPAVGRFVVI
jgi:hypothetical protein